MDFPFPRDSSSASTGRTAGPAMPAALRSGAWLTPERLRLYPALIGALLAAAVLVLAFAGILVPGAIRTPLGVDFAGVWVAGRAVLAGHAALVYDNAANAAAQAAFFRTPDSFLPWPYPPYFLGVAAALACLPFAPALAIWQGGTLTLYLAVIARAVRGAGLPAGDVARVALAFPAVAINVMHGQNGFLTAGLLAGAGLALPRRPWLAGLLFGLLAYKPQFALLVPFAVMAGGHWRCAFAGLTTVFILTLATLAAFGGAPWLGFVSDLGFTRGVILEGGGLEPFKLQSAFAAVRLLGGSLPLAYAVQGMAALAAIVGVSWLWRGPHDIRLKTAALAVASLLATPYAVDYDFVVLGPALAALVALNVEHGFPPYARSLLAFSWIMPLLARVVASRLMLPIGLFTLVALFGLILATAGASPVAPRTARS